MLSCSVRYQIGLERSEDVDPDAIGVRGFRRTPANHRHALGKMIEQTAFADARLAGDHDERRRPAIGGRRDQCVDLGEAPFPEAIARGQVEAVQELAAEQAPPSQGLAAQPLCRN